MLLLRRLHLYLGAFFAPMIIFMALSGIWQTLSLAYRNSATLLALSSIHVGDSGSKDPRAWNFSSDYLKFFILLTALSLIVNIVLGIVLAFKYRHGRDALIALALGVVIPVLLALLFAHQGRG